MSNLLFVLMTLIPSLAFAQKDKNMIDFKIRLNEKNIALKSKDIVLELTFKNKGTKSIKLNQRFAINTPTAPAGFREIHLSIIDPQGKAVPFSTKVKVGFPADTVLQPVAPDEVEMHTINLARYYQFSQTGRYTLKAFYESPKTAEVGKLESNEIDFWITSLTTSGEYQFECSKLKGVHFSMPTYKNWDIKKTENLPGSEEGCRILLKWPTNKTYEVAPQIIVKKSTTPAPKRKTNLNPQSIPFEVKESSSDYWDSILFFGPSSSIEIVSYIGGNTHDGISPTEIKNRIIETFKVQN